MRAYRSRLLQATQALRTDDDESSLSPTLTTGRNLLSPSMQRWKAHRAFRRLLPTLTAQSYGSTNNGTRDGEREYLTKGTPSLEVMAKRGKVEAVLLPTLTASSATRGKAVRGKNAQGGPSLQEALILDQRERMLLGLLPIPTTPEAEQRGNQTSSALLPTLTASEAKRGSQQYYPRGNPTLTGALMPTLCARDSKGPGPSHTKSGVDLPQKAGGHLSPEFCEWFMGYPQSWTALNDCGPSPRRRERGSSGSVTRSSPRKRKSSAGSSES